MDIRKIDKNLKNTVIDNQNKKDYYNLPCELFTLYGIKFDKSEGGFYRIENSFAKKISENVAVLGRHCAGGRIRFKTDAKYFGINVKYNDFWKMSHMALTGSCGLSVYKIENNKYEFVASFRPEFANKKGYDGSVELSGRMSEYIVFLPLYNSIDDLCLIFNKGANIEKTSGYNYNNLPIVYYGSSITQGGCASEPQNSYQALISKWSNTNYYNFGFSGSALGEEQMAEYISKIKPLIFVLDYDYNAPSVQYLEETHFKFYQTYRKQNKDTPIIMVSRPNYFKDKKDAEKRYKIIKKTYDRAKKEGDNNVFLIKGSSLFGKLDCENMTVDGCHPNDLGFYFMARKIYDIIKKII